MHGAFALMNRQFGKRLTNKYHHLTWNEHPNDKIVIVLDLVDSHCFYFVKPLELPASLRLSSGIGYTSILAVISKSEIFRVTDELHFIVFLSYDYNQFPFNFCILGNLLMLDLFF